MKIVLFFVVLAAALSLLLLFLTDTQRRQLWQWAKKLALPISLAALITGVILFFSLNTPWRLI